MIEIIVRGPGSIINYEYNLILKALKAADINVIEKNEYPEKNEYNAKFIHGRTKDIVILWADHCPCGGQ